MAHLVRHLAVSERRGPVLQARADRRRRPRARGPRARARPAPADAVLRQPRPARPADRRRARVRRRTSSARIDAGTLLEHDSPEEVEIRACALHAVELLVAAHPTQTTATAVDNVLWQRGAAPRYKQHPRHRAPHDRLLRKGPAGRSRPAPLSGA